MQVTWFSWVLEPTLPNLADFIKTNKKVLAGFGGSVAKINKPIELSSLGSKPKVYLGSLKH